MPRGRLEREARTCVRGGSSVRLRGLLRALSVELFGAAIPVPDFPLVPSLRGLGISDSSIYAERLRTKLDYRNTFYDREPRFDLRNPPPGEAQAYDFLIASEVFEHVAPPVEAAFENASALLKPNGVLLLTVPYSLEADTVERLAGVREFGLANVGGTVLVYRSPDGGLCATDRVAFHIGCRGPSPELREFSEAGLRAALARAGFSETRIYNDDCPEFGILPAEAWSLPIAARRGPFSLSAGASRDIVENWRDANAALRRLGQTWWFRIGRKLGLCA